MKVSVIIHLLSVYINAYKCELKAPSPETKNYSATILIIN